MLWIVFSYLIHGMPHASFELRYLIRPIVATVSAVAAAVYVWWSERANASEARAVSEHG